MIALKVISGGQTGVDRAALDAAIHCNMPHGGWVPQGRLAEDGKIDEIYVVQETATPDLSVRTEWNIRDSDATLILSGCDLKNGTKLTWDLVNLAGKPVLRLDIFSTEDKDSLETIAAWLCKIRPKILNVAGPRESEIPGIYSKTYALLCSLFSIAGYVESSDSTSQDLDVILARYEQAYENFRHWDQIRWLTPAWFTTLFAGLFASQLLGTDPRLRQFTIYALAGMIAFAILCVALMTNLVRYHNAEIDSCRSLVKCARVSPFQQEVLLSKLPFELKGWGFFKTATAWLMFLIVAILIASIVWLRQI